MTDAVSIQPDSVPVTSKSAAIDRQLAQADAPSETAEQVAPEQPEVCELPGANVVDVPVPQAGDRVPVAVQPGDVIRLTGPFQDISGAEVGGHLEMTFPGGGVVVVENFSAWVAAQGATVTDSVCGEVNLAEFIAGIGLVPEDVLPAAGLQGGPQAPDHNGAAFRPGPGPEILSGFPYPNILDPTALGYGLPEPEETFRPFEESSAPSDGKPIARDNTIDAVTNSVNLVIVFDRSGSMDEDPNAPGFTTRIDLARAAVASMLAAYESVANVNVLIVDFADTAATSGWLSGTAAANAYLAGLDAQGFTNYGAALQEVIGSYNVGLPNAGQTLVYFLSDGKPTALNQNNVLISDPLTAAEVAAWENFLTANGVHTAFAVGIGPDIDDNDGDLSDVAFPNDNPNNVIIITNEADTFDALVSTVVEAGGNVLTDAPPDDFGPDGPGSPAIVSIEVDGDLYEFDGAQITRNGIFFSLGSTLAVVTALGGQLTFNFVNGNYAYDVAGPGAAGQEVFTYTIADSNGDTSSATVAINLDDLQVVQPNRVFGTDGNDTLVGGDGINVISGGDGNDVIQGGDHGDHISGGAGADTIFGGAGNDIIVGGNQGEVANNPGVVRPGGADLGDIIDGGDGDDIIYGNEGPDSLSGGNGNDVLYGGSGPDTLDGGAGNDTIFGGASNDVITGGEGDDEIHLSPGGGSDTVRYTSVLDGHDIIFGFSGGGAGQDYLDLDALFDSLSVATADRAARVEIIDHGTTVDINVDTNGDGSFNLAVATLVTGSTITAGTNPNNDVQLGTL
jgi:Ca2+-binding RTX toxin-like protein